MPMRRRPPAAASASVSWDADAWRENRGPCQYFLQTLWMRRPAHTLSCRGPNVCKFLYSGFESVTRSLAGAGVARTTCGATVFAAAAAAATGAAATHAHVLLHLRIFGALV